MTSMTSSTNVAISCCDVSRIRRGRYDDDDDVNESCGSETNDEDKMDFCCCGVVLIVSESKLELKFTRGCYGLEG